ncbi:SpoIIE family protein phosphatase [Butyrivibrio sp. WCD2001]|uniref:SpoIIE family protein phosphatase n=1 Tax=Butyrivibrio sp. WCD2001 TaxID=1280681 RepID=UPI000427D5CD|nr:SpoIIE family protein phosphatase [Butyrivibrio sp. WCD2001]
MKKKIMRIMMIVSSLLLALVVLLTVQMIFRVRTILIQNAEKSGNQVDEYSDKAMRDQLLQQLSATTRGCSYIVNDNLENFAGTVTIMADAATDMYSHPERYGSSVVKIPEKSDIGKSMGQFLFSEEVDPNSPSVKEEISLLANMQGSLLAMYGQFPELGATNIGTETGLMLLAGPVLPERWDKDGNYASFDPRQRPWYLAAKNARRTSFSEIKEDYDTKKLAIMCGSPIYRDGEFVGAAGAGIYLEGIESVMMNARISDQGNSCIIDEHGMIIFSSQDEGDLKTQTILGEGKKDSSLKKLSEKAISGERGLELLEINGKKCYLAYSPIKVVGWSLISIVPESTVLAPKESLLNSLNINRIMELTEVQKVLRTALTTVLAFIVVIALITVVISNMLSRQLVKPVEELTAKVRAIEGDQLDFEWTEDTGDEIQELATSFGFMTERMKKYIVDIQAATAEKERIGVELALATEIQASILPHDFPPFPDRREFDIYAMMEPAREVGGDFYDFFLIDDDHLGLVMADVSGKGIPAALYMMISKVILQSCAMLGKSAAEALNRMNEALTSNNKTDMFVTVWFGILEISTGIISCANAGHEYPAIMRKDGKFELFKDKHGFVIGGMEGIKYKEYQIEIGHGDKLFLYTDGVAEATDINNKMYGTSRMIEALNKDPDVSPQQIVKTVRADISEFVGEAEQFDDLTMLCLEFN